MNSRLAVLLSLLIFSGMVITTRADVSSWPTNGWTALYGPSTVAVDGQDDTLNNGHEYLDIRGDTNYPAVFMLYRSAADSGESEDQLLFRVRVDDSKTHMNGAFQVFFETDQDDSVDWVLQLTTSDLDTDGIVEFGGASGTNRNGVAFGSVVWTGSYTGFVHWAGTPTDDGSMFSANSDYFVEFGMPWQVFTNYTSISSTNDPFRLLFTTSQTGDQIDDGDIANDAQGTGDVFLPPDFLILPVQTISFPNPGSQVATNVVTLLATASSGLPVGFSVVSGPGTISSGNQLTFSGPGVVSIVASQAGDGYWFPAPPVTNSFVVFKASPGINVSGLNRTYDGTAKAVSVTTEPASLPIGISYDGAATAPTNAGSYTVIVSVDTSLYEGAVTNTLTIAKADQTIGFPNPGPQVLTNSVTLTAAADSGLPIAYSVDSGPAVLNGSTMTFSGVGPVVIRADQAGNANWNAAPSTNVSFVVADAADLSLTLTGPTNVLVGMPMTFTVSVSNAGPSEAINAVVRDYLPTNVLFLGASAGGTSTNDTVVWPTIASFPAGATSNFTFTLVADLPAVITNAAEFSSPTFDLDPTNNSASNALLQLITQVYAAQFEVGEGAITLNPQTGLFEQLVAVTNTTPMAVPGFNILVDALPSGVVLNNASGTTNGIPYVLVGTALDTGEGIDVLLEYYVPSRQPFTNVLSVIWAWPEDRVVDPGGAVAVDGMFMDTSDPSSMRFIIEFATTPGMTYTVLYADTLAGPWYEAVPPILAGSTRTQWYDDGPPKTHSNPADTTNRFYRVIQH